MTNTARDALIAHARTTAAALGEHFEHVQILASVTDEQGTHSFYHGAGNWFARQGMAADFRTRAESETTAHYVANKLNGGEA